MIEDSDTMRDAKLLLSPIKIGSVTLPNRLVQAPLAGYSCAPFRVITQRYGNPGYCTTEMISARDLLYRNEKPHRYIWRDAEENILCYQVAAREEEDVVKACEVVTKAGGDILDLNCGCPVKKIRAKGMGTKLLDNPEKLGRLVRVMRENFEGAISVKMRVSDNSVEVAQAIEAAGADFIVVHGRDWTQRYDVSCRMDDVKVVVDSVNIPVFANGDVDSSDSAKKLFDVTGCLGIMIARASVGNPWLFEQIRLELNGDVFVPPSITCVGNVFREHVERLAALENDRVAALQARSLAKYYARYINEQGEFISKAQLVSSTHEIFSLIDAYYI